MRVKGLPSLFWVQHDAFDKLKCRLWYEYGIDIEDRGEFSGYIKKRSDYLVKFPILENGEIVSFLPEHVYIRKDYSLASARYTIIKRWREDPEYFEACYKSMHKIKES